MHKILNFLDLWSSLSTKHQRCWKLLGWSSWKTCLEQTMEQSVR